MSPPRATREPVAAGPPGTRSGADERPPSPRRLRPDLPFRRIALVLSGRWLGAYEVGVLRVVETRCVLSPRSSPGSRSGAINAVVWQAHGGGTAALEEGRGLADRDATVGMRWCSLLLRAVGVLVAMFAGLVEVVLTLIGRAIRGFVLALDACHSSASTGRPRPWSTCSRSPRGRSSEWSAVAMALSRPVESGLAHQRPVAVLGRPRVPAGARIVLGLWVFYVRWSGSSGCPGRTASP